ncbi:MAG: hypothetical protein K9L30_18015 [Desulfobacterales bacterium]|nr:hypothetical protein [Desulfobacterales bacterium]
MIIDEKMFENVNIFNVNTEAIHKVTADKFRKAASSKCFSDEDIHNHFEFMAGMLKSKSEDLFQIVREEKLLPARN